MTRNWESLSALLDALADDRGLWEAEAFAARADALDRLELAMLGGEGALLDTGIGQRAAVLARQLAETNRALCDSVRAAIRSGGCRGDAARRTLERLGGRGGAGPVGGYDLLDSLVSELLLDAEAPAATLPPAPERVAYQPTPARIVLELLERTGLGPADLFYDLGAGLGHVCLLVHLLSGAQACGIEIEPAYCRYAQRQAAALRLPGVAFVEADVRAADLADGTCYFMYTPFTGRTLAAVLDRLAAEAQQRPITVAAYGPCVAEVRRQGWLAERGDLSVSGLAVFRAG